jgi:formylglycine-generating enzyme required for sulfatase activity
VDTLRNLQANYGVTGKVTNFGGTYVVRLQLYEMRGGTMVGAEDAKSKDPLELYDPLVPNATARLLGRLPGVVVPASARLVVTPVAPAPVTDPAPSGPSAAELEAERARAAAAERERAAAAERERAAAAERARREAAAREERERAAKEEAEAARRAELEALRRFEGLEVTGTQESPTLGKLVCIGPGSFGMGSPASEAGRGDDETQHRVSLSKGFCVMETEVTQGMYAAAARREKKPSGFGVCGENCPVEKVSWLDAVSYANRVSKKEGLSAAYEISGDTVRLVEGSTGYRLLTEAEWEAAARGRELHVYSGSSSADSVGWTSSNDGSKTHPVKQLSPNGYGLYDMTGNVWEWTWDWYAESYGSGVQTDPHGPVSGSRRVYRGGGWSDPPASARVAFRLRFPPSLRNDDLGFRLARTAD